MRVMVSLTYSIYIYIYIAAEYDPAPTREREGTYWVGSSSLSLYISKVPCFAD